jgi:hypothetical protein
MAYKPFKKDGTPAKKPGKKSDPTKTKRIAKFVKGVERPHVWLCGPDKFKHDMYTPWMKAKAQANFRQEGWEMTFEEFYDIWKDHWHLRGRQAEDYCMTRIDSKLPWAKENIVIITRQEHLEQQGFKRKSQTKNIQTGYVKLRIKL